MRYLAILLLCLTGCSVPPCTRHHLSDADLRTIKAIANAREADDRYEVTAKKSRVGEEASTLTKARFWTGGQGDVLLRAGGKALRVHSESCASLNRTLTVYPARYPPCSCGAE